MTKETYVTLANDLGTLLKRSVPKNGPNKTFNPFTFFSKILNVLCVNLKQDNPAFNKILFKEAINDAWKEEQDVSNP